MLDPMHFETHALTYRDARPPYPLPLWDRIRELGCLRPGLHALEPPEASFDVAVAATSIHWMNLDVVVPKARRLLAPGGRLLVWRTVFGDLAVNTPFRDRIAEIAAERDAPPRPGPDAEDVTASTAALTRTGPFVADSIDVFRWSIEMDDDQVRRLFATFSDWSAGEVDRVAAAARDLGGHVVEHYISWLVALRPV